MSCFRQYIHRCRTMAASVLTNVLVDSRRWDVTGEHAARCTWSMISCIAHDLGHREWRPCILFCVFVGQIVQWHNSEVIAYAFMHSRTFSSALHPCPKVQTQLNWFSPNVCLLVSCGPQTHMYSPCPHRSHQKIWGGWRQTLLPSSEYPWEYSMPRSCSSPGITPNITSEVV